MNDSWNSWAKLQAPVRPAKPGLPSAWSLLFSPSPTTTLTQIINPP
jgi:hypothetical protein